MTELSKNEHDVLNFIQTFYKREIIKNYTINDTKVSMFFKDINIALDFCGLYEHSEIMGKHKKYHYNNTKLFQENEIQLLTLFEDEWVLKQDIIKSKLKSILGYDDREKVYARKCEIVNITGRERKELLNNYHIQGNNVTSINLGLKINEKLVAVMGLKYKENNIYDLNRFTTNCHVVGGFSKLLKYFQNNYNWGEIITFADLRWSQWGANLYQKNGFSYEYDSQPNYFYFKLPNLHRHSRVKFQKHKLHKVLESFDGTLTEVQNMYNNGYNRIFDCGNIKFIIKNEN